MAKKGEVSENKGNFKYTPDSLTETIAKYFKYCDNYRDADGNLKPKPYTRFGLIDFLGLHEDTFRTYEKGSVVVDKPTASDDERNNILKALSEAVKKAQVKINAQVEERQDAKSMFLLKQSSYAGYRDRDDRQDNSPIAITVEFKPQK